MPHGNDDDWLFYSVIFLGGFVLALTIESHFHILEHILDGLFGVPTSTMPVLAKKQVCHCPCHTPIHIRSTPQTKKLYPNPLYDPYADWDDEDDSWYYMY